ncbi:HD-GYP domain-containing protein [Oceanispirochaeta crateris]|uniref:HD-GYP domain-containing protein n=1 Tax=Oceanispirochaeta crateris TaxID=2518645 RepID=A0A5C1QQ15_9SPIO|nr:HD-GYP domain-containing protein [Oceanispirochaeta crateris]QEN08676.1 HD-GYP domain-containing protein [Oceanispirochaeta crateris]
MKAKKKIPYYLWIIKARNLMIKKEEQGKTDSLLFWQQYIFVSLMVTMNTMGLVVLVPGMKQFIEEGMKFAAIGLAAFYVFFVILSFSIFISFKLRQKMIAWGFYALSIFILIFTGPWGAGQLYLCTAFVLILLQTEKDNSKEIILINILVFALLSLLYIFGESPMLTFKDYGAYWWLIVFNSITVSLFIVLMIDLIMKGLNRRFKKSKLTNAKLERTQNGILRQIHLLNSLRQSGMVIMDSRLKYEERMQSALLSIKEELPCSALSVSLAKQGSNEAQCIASIPDSLIEEHNEIPKINGPFLLLKQDELDHALQQSNVMKFIKPGELYFASHFFTPDSIGFLELLLGQAPVESDLNFLQMSLFQLSAAITNDQLIQDIRQSHDILESSYDEILQAWAKILELRDLETRGHSSRVVSICLNIAKMINLPLEDQVQLKRGAFLHDIGKLGIPDRILKKKGPLTEEEWELMRQHPEIGRNSVMNIPFLKPAICVIYHHHERWNGKGYPEGLKGEEIPYPARIFMIADVYDALISDRPYRKAMKQDEIIEYMLSERGTFFDPDLLDLFLKDIENLTDQKVFDTFPLQ